MNPLLIDNLPVFLLSQTVRIQCLPTEIPYRVGVIGQMKSEHLKMSVSLCTSVCKNGRRFIDTTVMQKLMTKCLEKCVLYFQKRNQYKWRMGENLSKGQIKALKWVTCVSEVVDSVVPSKHFSAYLRISTSYLSGY